MMTEETVREKGSSGGLWEHPEPNYLNIFWWLVALTVLEVIVATAATGPLYTRTIQGFLLVAMALGKASLVALYFMHLKYEKKALGAFVLVPLILCAIIILFLVKDIRAPVDSSGAHTETAAVEVTAE